MLNVTPTGEIRSLTALVFTVPRPNNQARDFIDALVGGFTVVRAAATRDGPHNELLLEYESDRSNHVYQAIFSGVCVGNDKPAWRYDDQAADLTDDVGLDEHTTALLTALCPKRWTPKGLMIVETGQFQLSADTPNGRHAQRLWKCARIGRVQP